MENISIYYFLLKYLTIIESVVIIQLQNEVLTRNQNLI